MSRMYKPHRKEARQQKALARLPKTGGTFSQQMERSALLMALNLDVRVLPVGHVRGLHELIPEGPDSWIGKD